MLACVAVAVLCACGGGGGTGSAPVPGPQPTGPGVAQLSITIPSTGPSNHARRPRFVSQSVAGIAVTINGTAVDQAAIAQRCGANPDGSATCTYTFPAPSGNDVFAIALLDGARVTLATGTVTAQIASGQTTTLHLTFGGVPASAALQLDKDSPPVGAAATITLTVAVFDADRNRIIGDAYAVPVAVTSDDTTGNITLSKTTVSSPTDTILITYNGKLIPKTVIFSVAPPLGGAFPSTVRLAPNPYTTYGPTAYTVRDVAPGPDGNVWFTECGNTGSACKIGSITPSGAITESADVPYAARLTTGPDGNVWFTEGVQPYIGRITPGGAIQHFLIPSRAPANGADAGPIVTGPDGKLWFAEGDRIGSITTAGIVNEYLIGGLFRPDSIVVGADGALWFGERQQIGRITTAGAVTQYPVDSSGYLSAGPLVLGPDGKLNFWAGTAPFNPVSPFWTMTPSGATGQLTLSPRGARFTPWIGTGPDGNMWGMGGVYDAYAFAMGIAVSSSTFSGTVTTYLATPLQNIGTTFPSGYAAWGPDRNLWIADGQGIARFRYNP